MVSSPSARKSLCPRQPVPQGLMETPAEAQAGLCIHDALVPKAQGHLSISAAKKVKKKMSANLEAKKVIVEDIKERFQKAQSVVVVHYSGITVEEVTKLRNQFRELKNEMNETLNNI